jgi:hypothetical protein
MLWISDIGYRISDIGNRAIEVYRTAAPVLDFNLHPSGVNYQPAWYRLDINEIRKPSDGYWTD